MTEEATGSAKSVFHFDVQGSVAKSTHAGIPWLRYIRSARPEVHFWPFDGWAPAVGVSVIAESSPRLWSAAYPQEARTADQHDAYSIARWLQEASATGMIDEAFAAPEPESVAMMGRVEGWILGSTWPPLSKPRGTVKPTKAATPVTTRQGYINRNRQEVLVRTGLQGNDHNQVVYLLKCHACGARYGANGSDIFQRRCPDCDSGCPGLATT